ncbi:MAG: NAD(P)/FAD-dependent oxidoreductase [Ruminococcus callidus]
MRPIVLERGKCVEQRQEDVTNFRKTGVLCTESNVQFGEGGAGTFSDGKRQLALRIHNSFCAAKLCRMRCTGRNFYLAKPHIGTDKLVHVVREMRKTIQRYGGEILFQAHMEKLVQKNGKLTAVQYQKDGKTTEILTSYCILAVGHSARDVFEMLYNANISMMQKNFAVGMRIEHSQDWLNHAMYGREASPPELPVADYKLAVHLPNKHSLYTFCMCPGGEVVAASSEQHRLVVNGMSNSARNGRNANSALLVGVSRRSCRIYIR